MKIKIFSPIFAFALSFAAPVASQTMISDQAFSLCLKSSKGDAAALSTLNQSALNGDAETQFLLGNMYFYGLGVLQNYTEAMKWYTKAADQGYDNAQFEIGSIYYTGKGVTQDYAGAAKWFRKAAKQGDGWAQNNLGVMYREGLGVPKDDVEAASWLKKAADQGYIKGQDIAQMKVMLPMTRLVTLSHFKPERSDFVPAHSNPMHPNHAPSFPPLSLSLGEQGSAVVNVYVLADGKVGEAKIIESSGYARIDEAIVSNILENWHFLPATLKGEPVPSWKPVKVTLSHLP